MGYCRCSLLCLSTLQPQYRRVQPPQMDDPHPAYLAGAGGMGEGQLKQSLRVLEFGTRAASRRASGNGASGLATTRQSCKRVMTESNDTQNTARRSAVFFSTPAWLEGFPRDYGES